MEIVHDGLILCADCAYGVAYGETSEEHDQAFTDGMARWEGYDLVISCGHDDESECESRGWYRCAVCDVHTFGAGHDAVTFRRSPVHA